MHIIVPLYIFPSPNAWDPLMDAAAGAKADLRFTVIVNPCSGPGSTTYPHDPEYMSAIPHLNSLPSIRTIGYVPLGYGTRDLAEVKKDIATYAGWASYTRADIHVEGIFFDETPSGSQWYSFVEAATAYAKAALPKTRNEVVLNPGVLVEERYLSLADEVIVFENSYSEFNLKSLSNGVPERQRSKAAVIIHGFTGDDHQLSRLLEEIGQAGFGGVFITTKTGYETWSDLWNTLCSPAPRRNGSMRPRTGWLKFLGLSN